MDILERLQQWYSQQCNGEWEHSHGITIESCDNPGWWIKINVAGTPLHQQCFSPIVENIDNNGFPKGSQWLSCYLKDGIWHGAGDKGKLPTILAHFLSWVDSSNPGNELS